MDLLAFAAARRERLTVADDDLTPFVRRALENWGPGDDWYAELVEAASVLWLEIFDAEAPNADADVFMPRFHEMLGEALSKTTKPADPPAQEQVDRITYWLSTATVNNATYFGNRAHGGNGMRWATMHDESVRGSHRAADGQIATRDGTFDIGGFNLRYPGEPVGPPEIWINCRCVLVPARVEGAFDVTDAITADGTTPAPTEDDNPDVVVSNNVTAAVDDPFPNEEEGDGIHVDEDEIVDDEPEEDEELITEIPVHGLIAPESVMSGDYRMFAEGALSTRNLPVPLRYEYVSSHGGDTSMVATVGRVDEVFMAEDGMRFRGAIVLNRQYAPEVIEGLLDGTNRGVSLDGDMGVIEIDPEDDNPAPFMTKENPAVFSEVRVAGLTIVPIPAFQEAYLALGAEFPDELSEEQLVAAAQALEDCGCAESKEAADAAVAEFRDVPTDERKRLAEGGEAMPDGSFPIANEEDLRNAIQSIGRAKDPDAARAHIKRRARALGKEDLIPEDWSLVASAFAPGTHDGPGWITHPVPTARIRRYWVRGKGAAKIRWGAPGDFNRCRMQLAKYVQNPDWLAGLCANMHKEAIGVWPGQEGGGGHAHALNASAAPIMTLVAAGVTKKPAAAFKNPNLAEPTPTTIEEMEDGTLRIFGHLAAWGVCHIGIQDTCTTAPHSSIDYAMFRTGTVLTDEGRFAVGQITMGTGHAGLKVNARNAVAHYDNTGTAVADVVVGEDGHGIWFSGIVRPSATQEQIDALQASALSGDWRRNGTGLELVAALAVNVPGFPIPRTSLAASGAEGQESLVAAGVVRKGADSVLTAQVEEVAFVPASEIAGIIRATVQEVRAEDQRRERIAALQPFMNEVRVDTAARLADTFGKD